jgi:hypothetical protein
MTTRSARFGLACSGIACLLPFLALAGNALLPLSAAAGHQQGKPADVNRNWGQATFHGLVVGKSTSADVIREFGKPKWKGGVQELVVPSDKDGELQYQYSSPSDVNGDVYVYFRRRTGVVSAILFYPKSMTRADAIAQFGSDFEESNEKLGPCPTAQERKAVEQYHIDYGVLLVYRRLGLYVDIKKDGSAFLISYVRSCR